MATEKNGEGVALRFFLLGTTHHAPPKAYRLRATRWPRSGGNPVEPLVYVPFDPVIPSEIASAGAYIK